MKIKEKLKSMKISFDNLIDTIFWFFMGIFYLIPLNFCTKICSSVHKKFKKFNVEK